MRRERSLTDRQKKWIAGTGVFLFLVLSALVCWFAGRPLIRFVREPERFQAWVDAQGVRASGAVTLLVRGSYSIL